MKHLLPVLLGSTLLTTLAGAAASTPAPTVRLEDAGGIAAHVARSKIAGVDLIAYPTGVKDVVTFRGALPAGDAFAADGNPAIPTLVGMMLDKGTTTEDKFAITEKLERVGATITFDVDTQMADIDAKCLTKDVPLVVGLIAEQLRSPAFSDAEFEKVKKQFVGGMQRRMENTDFRAADAFSRAVYPVGHPNRRPAPEVLIKAAQEAKLADAKAFHARYYGPAHFTLVVVGDLDVPQIQRAVGQAFAGWSGGADVIHPAKAAMADAPRDQTVFMPDKTSVTVVLGEATGLQYRDPDDQALRVATAILGSGFTGRLMATVRDREGLTYGIGSAVSHDTFTDGDWHITATFAPALLEKGLASTRREFAAWYEKGVTEDELQRRKGDLVGTFKVGLATTEGMATALLDAVHRGYGVGWIDEYPRRIQSLTTAELNAAIKKHLSPTALCVVKAGTVPAADK